MREKTQWIKDLSTGMAVNEMFVIAELRSGPRPTGNQPLKFNLRDATGIIHAHMWWQDAEEYNEKYALVAGAYNDESVVLAQGVVNTYHGESQLEVRSLEVLEDGEFAEFPTIPSIEPEELQRLEEELLGLVRKNLESAPDSADARFAGRILEAFLSDEGFMDRFRQAPGARFYHHARRGGLLEHTYNVTRLAVGTAKLFNKTYGNAVSEPLVLSGALLHDVGKMDSYEIGRRDIRDTFAGQTVGHIFLGMMAVQRVAEATFVPEELVRLPALLHIIASHHGQAEFGAPVEPKFPEAFIIYYADDLDAKLEHISRTMAQDLPGYSIMLKRVLFPPVGWGE